MLKNIKKTINVKRISDADYNYKKLEHLYNSMISYLSNTIMISICLI